MRRAGEKPWHWKGNAPGILPGVPQLALIAITLLLASPAAAAGQMGRKSWEFFPHLGVFVPSDPAGFDGARGFEDFDPGVMWGLYATYHYTDYVGVEMGFSKATANHADALVVPAFEATGLAAVGVGDVSFDFWELSGFLNSGALKSVQVFATAGGGLVNYDPENAEGVTRLLLHGGGGVRYYAWKNIALRGEVKDYFFVDATFSDYTGNPLPASAGEGPVGPEDDVHNLAAFVGITFNF